MAKPPDLKHKQASQDSSKSWDGILNETAGYLVDFLRSSGSKRTFENFVIELYQKIESEHVDRFIQKSKNETKVDNNRTKSFHTHGNIGSLLYNEVNMNQTEQAFTQGIRSTQEALVKTSQSKANQIENTLGTGGGISHHLAPEFTKNVLNFLEMEDPRKKQRKLTYLTALLPTCDLKEGFNSTDSENSHKIFMANWDDTVNAFTDITTEAGLKSHHVKNDRKHLSFQLTQDLISNSDIPDEFFSYTLEYITAEKLKIRHQVHQTVSIDFEKRIKKLKAKVSRYNQKDPSATFQMLKNAYKLLVNEQNFFVNTVPDPRQLEPGILVSFEAATIKDYQTVKNRMQSVMNKFLRILTKKIANKNTQEIVSYTIDQSKLRVKKVENGITQYIASSQDLRPIKKKAKKS